MIRVGRAGRLAWVCAFGARVGLSAVVAGFGCSSRAPLATLQQQSGGVERDFGGRVGDWQRAEIGNLFGLGDGVQTLPDGKALLSLDEGSRLSMEKETLVRFSELPPDPQRLAFDVDTGVASLEVGDAPLSLRTRVGLARMEPHTTIQLTPSPDGLRFVVQVGRAVFGESEPLLAGQGVLVGVAGSLSDLAKPSLPIAVATATRDSPALTNEGADHSLEIIAHVAGAGASVKNARGWLPLAPGAGRLSPGSELKLAGQTTVLLERGEQRALLHQNGRYLVAPHPGVLVAASEGSLSAGSLGAVSIEVPGGVIVVAPRGRAILQLTARGTRLDVEAQTASIETGRQKENVHAGERAELSRNGELRVEGRGVDYADIEIRAGESVVVHDPKPPTAVRFQFGEICAEGGSISAFRAGKAGHFATGLGAVALSLPAGSYRYELSCSPGTSEPARRGSLDIAKDPGTRRMPERPPSTALAADGRQYTVLYQNRLPGIALSWPNAPQTGPWTLLHEFEGKSETLQLDAPKRDFGPGKLAEGRHAFYFEGAGRVSRHTSVQIAFDNAAPTVTLTTPVTLAAKPGDPVTLSGTALPGWDVLVEGRRPSKDAQGRFSATLPLPTERRALAVRLSHPQRGTHLYLRRGQTP